MYSTFFGLKQAPFSIAPDPRYLFMSDRHREALAHLLYGVGAGGGFVLLSGEIGAGKTTVCRCFLEQMPPHCRVAYIFNPKLTVTELLQTVCDEFGIAMPAVGGGAPSVKDHTDALNAFLLAAHAAGDSCVLVIDEAQNLSADVLEQLRLLTNLETSERKLLQVILIGQPELRDLLARPELEQLAQRVVARFHLGALSADDTVQYVQHRLGVAGWSGPLPFDAAALARIHTLSRGVPRRINLLCDRALLGAYAQGRKTIDRRMVEQAAGEVFDNLAEARERATRAPTMLWAGLGLLVGAVLTLGFASRYGAPLISRSSTEPATARPLVASMPAASAAPGRAGPASAAPAAVSTLPAASNARSTSPAPVLQAAGPAVAAMASGSTPAASDTTPAASDQTASLAAPRGAAAPAAAAASDTLLSAADLWRDSPTALSALAARWGGEPAPVSPTCESLARRQLPCYQSRGSFASVRRLDRPALLTVLDAAARPGQVLLIGLSDDAAEVVTASGQTRRMPLALLSRQWRGDFMTLWRSPPGFAGQVVEGNRGPVVQVLAEQLDRWAPAPVAASASAASGARVERDLFTAALKARLIAFQVWSGLSPDGVARPTVFMQLNRLAKLDEPRLQIRN